MPDFRRELEQRAVAIWAPIGIAEVVQIVVRQAGARRVLVANGTERLEEILSRTPIGLVLVDEASTAPGPFELAATLDALPAGSHLPMTILMASAPTRRLVNQALSAGIGSVIAKPFSARRLLDCAARAHAAREARRANLANRAFLD